MSNANELDKTIEELEAEVIAELDEAKTKQPNDSGLKAEPGSKVEGERQDMGPAVVSPDAKSDPGKEATKKAKEISGDAQQKGEKPAEKPKKLAAGDEVEHDGEELDEKSSKKEDFPPKKDMKKDDDEDEDEDEVVDEKKEETESRIKDIDVAEDVEALVGDEDDLSEEFKTKAATIFEAAVKSKVRIEVDRISEEMKTEFDNNIDSYKEELTEKVDNYLNYVVEQWSKDNELAIERGLKGEIAEDFISGLKQLFEDHYVDVPDEKYDVLEAQSDKITELEGKLDEAISNIVSLRQDKTSLIKEKAISEATEDLADTEIEKFKSLTGDVEFTDESSFKEKLDTLKESYFPKQKKPVETETVINDEESGNAQDVDVTGSMNSYMRAIGKFGNGAK